MPLPGITATRIAELLPPRDDSVATYRWLADGLRLLIADGRIPAGQALPAERRLTEALGVSRTTVTKAYAHLGEAGFATARQGSAHVACLPLDRHHLGVGGALLPGAELDPDTLDLTCAASRAPAGTIEAYTRAVATLPAYLAGTGYATAGLIELRTLIADRYAERGLPTTPDQIMVVNGALAGVNLAARALIQPGDRVLVETPSYPNTLQAARRRGARLVPLPVEATGWDLEQAAAMIAASRPSVALLIVDFHNPTGSLMADEDRARLASALRRSRTIAVVDETMLEVRLNDALPPLPFAAYLPNTVLVGSASKSHWGGLRIGWLRVPSGLGARMAQHRIIEDLGAPLVEQLATIELLRARPGLHPERKAELVRARQAMIEHLPAALPGATWTVPDGGMSLWVQLPRDRATALAQAAVAEGLLLSPGSQFAAVGGLERFVRLPYKDPAPVVAEAMLRLGNAWRTQAGLPQMTSATRPRPIVA